MDKDIVVLNPDYHFKNDNDRIVMYSKKKYFIIVLLNG